MQQDTGGYEMQNGVLKSGTRGIIYLIPMGKLAQNTSRACVCYRRYSDGVHGLFLLYCAFLSYAWFIWMMHINKLKNLLPIVRSLIQLYQQAVVSATIVWLASELGFSTIVVLDHCMGKLDELHPPLVPCSSEKKFLCINMLKVGASPLLTNSLQDV